MSMPIKPANNDATVLAIIHGTYRTYSIWQPDVRPDDNLLTPPTFTQEPQDIIPSNFDELSPEEQKRIKDRIRFRGIRMREDIKGQTINLTRRTLDIP